MPLNITVYSTYIINPSAFAVIICCHSIGLCVSKLALRTFCYPSFFVGLQSEDFVETWPHLGHIISHNCDDSDDLCAKRASLIGKVNKILCTYRNVT